MKKNSKVEITEIVLQMGATKVSMSLEDAEKVFKVLEKIFGRKVEKEYVPYGYPVYRPYRWYYEPYYGTITCGANDSVGISKTAGDLNTSSLSWEVGKSLKVSGTSLMVNAGNVQANIVS